MTVQGQVVERGAAVQPQPQPDVCEMSRLFALHNAQKCTEHGPLYQQLLEPFKARSAFVRMLEIGVERGGSLRAFREFLPQAFVYGLDIKPQCSGKDLCVVIFTADAADNDNMQDVACLIQPLDCVIDDGGHTAAQQQTAFSALWPVVSPGGLYVIEDLHVSGKGGKFDSPGSGYAPTIEWLDTLNVDMEWHYCQGFDKDICVVRK